MAGKDPPRADRDGRAGPVPGLREEARTFFRLSPDEWAARHQSCAVRRGDAKQRLDPHFHAPAFRELAARIAARPHLPLARVVGQSDEMWNREASPDGGANTFRYLEISAVGLGTGDYSLESVPVADAPSRARMFLRGGDLVVSTTRPHRGAIAEIQQADAGAIGSTGFAVLREQRAKDVRRDFLRNVLLSDPVLTQLLQRSSGGAYPAITPDELERVLIPTPDDAEQKRLVAALDAARGRRKKMLADAGDLLDGLDGFVLDQLGLTLPPPATHRTTYAVRLRDVVAGKKLYPDYFHPERINAIKAVQSKYPGDRSGALASIADFRRDQRQVQPNDSYLGLANVQPNTGERIDSTDEDGEGTVFDYAENDVLLARLRPYLNKVYRAESGGVCSPEFHVMRVHPGKGGKPSVIPDYLAAVLRSGVVLAQTRHMMTGNTHPRLANDDVVNLVVPIPDGKVQTKIAAEVARRRAEARRLRADADTLWEEAKADFEAALLGPPVAGGKGGK